jgi:hypothetical protein
MLQMLQGHVSSKDAHEMMMLMVMPCYDHAQMMPKCKATPGVLQFVQKNKGETHQINSKWAKHPRGATHV